MFIYLRYFSIVSFFIILVATFIIGIYFRSVAAHTIIKSTVERNNIILADFFTQKVWLAHQDVYSNISPDEPRVWLTRPEFRPVVSETARFLREMPAVKVNLYTVAKKRFLSSSPHQVQFADTALSNFIFSGTSDETIGLVTAQSGRVFSRLIIAARFTKDDVLQNGTVIQTFVPLLDKTTTPHKVQAIMEIVTDISSPWRRLYELQVMGSMGVIFIFTLLFGALFYISGKAERIIEKQHEANTELAAAKSKAEAENIEKSKFLANVSHELRTPLNAIIGFSAIIKDEVSGPINNPLYKDYIIDIHTSGSHLLSLINDILDYSKAEADKLQVESVDVDVAKTVKTCLRLMAPRAEEAKVHLKELISREHLVLKTDPKRLKQVLLNLLSNSVKFTPEGGSVTLSATVDDDNGLLILQVQDTGIGIADKDISKAMTTFGQVDNALSRKYEGTGLGLPLTRKLTELMGGNFQIQSELGFGTIVTLSFPYNRRKELSEQNYA
jgi:two-component system, cell cycle sensor histidine kinase PleC